MTKIAFRMDDITADMDWNQFYRFKDMFDQYHIKPLIGVVPDNRDEQLNVSDSNPNFWNEIRNLASDGWVIAQHGYQHLYETNDPGILGINNRSEFSSLPLEVQRDKIVKGQKILKNQGIETEVWMAPAHSYDENTLLALNESGFRYVTDGYALFPYQYKNLKFIPCQTSMPFKIPFGILTVCIHANTVTNSQLDKINRFIKDNEFIIRDYKELLMTPAIGGVNPYTEKMLLVLRKLKKLTNIIIKS